MDGLLTRDKFQARAGWWAYKTYADGVPTRVAATTSDPLVVPLASSGTGANQPAQLVIGYFNFRAAAAPMRVVAMLNGLDVLPEFAGSSTVSVRIEKIPASGESAIAELVQLGTRDIPIINGSARVELPELSRGEAYRLTLVPIP